MSLYAAEKEGGGDSGCGLGWGKGYGKALVPQSVPLISVPTLFLKNPVEKNEHHIRILAGFMGSGWGKRGGENSFGLKAFGDQ